VLALVAGHEPAAGGDDAPPRDIRPLAQQATHGPSRARVARFLGDLAIGDDRAGTEAPQHTRDIVLERHRGLIVADRRGTSVP
jgi:hypothetical protein